MSKPRVAFFDFACCEGCQLQIVNLEEELVDLLGQVDVVEFREAISDRSDDYDIAFIEGSITRPQDEERLRHIRSRAKILIAFGSCATTGGVNALKNNFDLDEVKRCVYGDAAKMPHLATGLTKAAHEVVPVDYKIHGCPVNRDEVKYIVRCLLMGKQPEIPNYPVCVECKMKENQCRFELGEVCMGPITRAGCGACCPSASFWCYGCRGMVDDPNTQAAFDVLEKWGVTVEELKSRMKMFCSNKEASGLQVPEQEKQNV